MKPAHRSAEAQADIEVALAHYQSEAPHMAGNFLNALEKAAAHIQRAPGTGSPSYAHALDIPGLRFWRLGRFPYAVFYLEHQDHLLVIRLVYMSRDIPVSLQA